MTERQEQMIYDEGRRRGFCDGYEACKDELAEKMMERIEEDGTLVIGVKDATKVTRVLVEDDKKNGDLYYVMSDDTFEWCHDCKEYDQEKHCCHRWTKVIRQTVEELKAYRPKGEWIYCEDYVGHDGYKCSECGFFVPWCYDVYADSNFIRHYHTCPYCDSRMKGADDE